MLKAQFTLYSLSGRPHGTNRDKYVDTAEIGPSGHQARHNRVCRIILGRHDED